MKKPIILIYTNVFETTVGQGRAYMNFFSQFGDVLLVTSEMDIERMIALGDILALPGGQDLNSDRYGIKPGFMTKEINVQYEYLDKYLLKPWIETGKPIIGICRGMQALNVACGGTLHRHISGHVQDDTHWRYDTPQKMFTLLETLTGIHTHPIVKINSYHHQAIDELAPDFVVLGWSEYGSGDRAANKAKFEAQRWYTVDNKLKLSKYPFPMIPEIMEHTTRPYIAFQYHPEEFNCSLAIDLITETLHKYDTQQHQKEKESTIIINDLTANFHES